MDHQALKAVIDAEPANAARSDAEVLAWLSADVVAYREVGSRDLLGWAAVGDRLDRLSAARENGSASASSRTRAQAAYLLITREDTALDWAKHGPLVQAMVVDGTLTDDEAAELQAMGQISRTRWPGRVVLGDVVAARALA